MKCKTCGKKTFDGSTICSDKCNRVINEILKLNAKYTPTNGCDNCWGDLHQGCSDRCKKEFKDSQEFIKDLWSIISIIYPKR